MDAYTIPEAAEATGLSPRAVRTRVEEGELRALDRDGVRMIPRSELERNGLLALAGEPDDPSGEQVRLVRASPEDAACVLSELIERLDAHGAELDALKALVFDVEAVWRDDRARSEREVAEARSATHAAMERVAELEAQRERDKPSFHREALTPLFERTERRRPRPA